MDVLIKCVGVYMGVRMVMHTGKSLTTLGSLSLTLSRSSPSLYPSLTGYLSLKIIKGMCE